MIFYLVLLIPCFCLFICPLSVAGAKSGRYFWTARAVNPGRVENCLLLIVFRIVYLGVINYSWWRYFIIFALDVMSYALYVVCLVWTFCDYGDVLLFSCSFNIHNLVCNSRPHSRTSFLL